MLINKTLNLTPKNVDAKINLVLYKIHLDKLDVLEIVIIYKIQYRNIEVILSNVGVWKTIFGQEIPAKSTVLRLLNWDNLILMALVNVQLIIYGIHQ